VLRHTKGSTGFSKAGSIRKSKESILCRFAP
jgi:hypothetical protein